jgi:TonB family protein
MEKYLRGELNMAEREIVQKHLDGSPFDREALEGFQKHSSAQVDNEIKVLQADVRQMAEKTPKAGLIRSLKRTYWYAAAAIVVLFGVSAFIIFMVRGPVIQTQLAVNQPDTKSVMADEPILEDQKQAFSENETVPVTQQVTRINVVEDDAPAIGEELTKVTEEAEVTEVLVDYEVIVDDETGAVAEIAYDVAAEDAQMVVQAIGGVAVTDDRVYNEEKITGSEKRTGSSYQTLARSAVSKGNTMVTDDAPDTNLIFTVVEKMPEFPGGGYAFYNFLADSIQYPQLAIENKIQGKVYVQFVVEEDGSITNIKVLRGIGGGCDEEALRVIKLMPNWIPGKQNGKPVRVLYNLPIKFILNKHGQPMHEQDNLPAKIDGLK